VSSIISDVKDAFPNFAWWALVFQLLIIIFVTVVVGYEAEETYNIAVRSRHVTSQANKV
jgi:hypothetical protein